QDEVSAKSVPRQLANQPVILVAVIQVVSEDHIGLQRPAQFVEHVLELFCLSREITITEPEETQLGAGRLRQPPRGGRAGFLCPPALGGEDRPYEAHLGTFACPTDQGCTTADLDVVAMRTDA